MSNPANPNEPETKKSMSAFKKFLIGLGIFTLICLMFLVKGCSYAKAKYNEAYAAEQEVNKKWSAVEAQYQRRFDLIPNIVAIVEASANFEKSTLTGISQAQASIGSLRFTGSLSGGAPTTQDDIDNFAGRQQMLGTMLSRLMHVEYKFPDLKTTERFRDLQVQVEGTENRITVSRTDFNDSVEKYNKIIGSFIIFPGLSLKKFGWVERAMFRMVNAEAERAPRIQMNSLMPVPTPTPAPAPTATTK